MISSKERGISMSRSRHSEAEMIAALKQVDAGRAVEDVAREVGVSKHTIYAWKAKYGGGGCEPVENPLREIAAFVFKAPATATDASRTIRLITAPFIDQLADGYFPEVHSLAKLANLSNELARILLLSSVGRNQFGNGNAPPGNSDGFALGDSSEQSVEMSLGVKGSDSGHRPPPVN